MPMTLRVRNWQKWQSYRSDRGQPPWIKVHRRLAQDPAWVQLTDAQRGQLVAMWILAADRDGTLPSDRRLLARMCFMDSEPDLEVFVSLGFLDRDASVTPERRQHDRPEAEAEAEKRQSRPDAFMHTAREDRVGWEALDRTQQIALSGLYGLNGVNGTQEQIWGGIVDRDERMRLVETALLQLQAEGHERPTRGSFFRKVLQRVIANEGTGPEEAVAW